MSRRIVVIEDHPIVREGYIQLLNQESDLEVIGQAASAHEGLEIIRDTQPDLALIDLSLKDGNGLELIKDLRKQFPSVYCLVISLHDENIYAERVLKAGGRGYIMKSEAVDNVMQAVRRVLSGQVYLSSAMSSRILDRLSLGSDQSDSINSLSDRELEVLQMIGRGLKTQIIAENLNLSTKTVDTYKTHLKTKLGLTNATELIQYAAQWVMKDGGTNI